MTIVDWMVLVGSTLIVVSVTVLIASWWHDRQQRAARELEESAKRDSALDELSKLIFRETAN